MVADMLLYYLYGSPGTEVMKANSFFHAELNFVLYVAAPASFLDFFGLGGDSAGLHHLYHYDQTGQSPTPSYVQSHSFCARRAYI